MKKQPFFIIVILFSLFSCKNAGRTEHVTGFDTNCNKFEIDIKNTPLVYEDDEMWICENPGFSKKYIAFIKKCGTLTFENLSAHGVEIDAFQGNVVHFDTKLLLGQASWVIRKAYTVKK